MDRAHIEMKSPGGATHGIAACACVIAAIALTSPFAAFAEEKASPPADAKAGEKGAANTNPPPAQGQKPEKRKAKPTLIVFNIVPEQGVGKGAANLLTEIVIDKAARLRTYEVIGQKDLEKMVFWEKTKMAAGCNETSCLVEIAGAMDASFYIEGSIGVMGDQFVVTLKLMDARDVRVIERATELVKRDDNAVVKAVAQMANTVLGVPEPAVGKSTLAGPAGVGAADVGAAADLSASRRSESARVPNPPVPGPRPPVLRRASEGTQGARQDNDQKQDGMPGEGRGKTTTAGNPAQPLAPPPPKPAPPRAHGLAAVQGAPAAPTPSRQEKPLTQNVAPATGQRPAATAPATVAASEKKTDAGKHLQVKDRAEPDDQAATFRTLGKVGVFGGLGVATLGGLFTVLAKKSADDYRKGENPVAMQGALDNMDRLNKLAIGSYIVGGLAVAGGVGGWMIGTFGYSDEKKAQANSPSSRKFVLVPEASAQSLFFSAVARW